MQIQNKTYILSIAYNNYQTGIGGVDKAVLAQKEKLKCNKISYIFLFPQLARVKKRYILAHVWEVIADDRNCGLYTTEELWKALLKLQKDNYQLQSITIHHLLNIYFPDLYYVLNGTKGTIQVIIHDYYTICPQCFLLKNYEKFCGEEGYQEEKCKSCKSYPDVKLHVIKMMQFFQDYQRRIQLIFPSEHAEQLWSKAYPNLKLEKKIIPHLILRGEYQENLEYIQATQPIKIAYIGQQLYLKGWNIWKKLYLDKKLENGYQTYYIGMGKDIKYAEKNIKISFQKDGKDAMLNTLRKLKITCAILWSICPETYSYVYYECLAANLFIITNADSGNIAAMVRKNGNGIVLNRKEELEELMENPIRLKHRINDWRMEKRLGAKVLSNNERVFETEGIKAEVIENIDKTAESKIKIWYEKTLIQIVKLIKKIAIKWFY